MRETKMEGVLEFFSKKIKNKKKKKETEFLLNTSNIKKQ